MAHILPGTLFKVEVFGTQYEVRALTLSRQEKVAELVQKMIEAEKARDGSGLAGFAMAKECLTLCCGPDKADALAEEVDAEMAIQISSQCLGKASVDDDDKKKLESEP